MSHRVFQPGRTLFNRAILIGTGCLFAGISAFTVGCGGSDDPAPLAAFKVASLSSRLDLISGGSTLLQVTAPAGVALDAVKVTLNGSDVTAKLATRNGAEGTMRGLVDGLTTDPFSATGSKNTLVVSSTSGSTQTTTVALMNFPITGPMLSGPHITPYECRTVQNNLGNPLDANCSATTQIRYYYRATDNSFKPLTAPTAQPRPADLVNTTTNNGNTVPYIVRVESGTINRGVYNLAMLDNPVAGSAAFAPGPGWNGKLVLAFGCCGAANFNQGVMDSTTALSHTELSRGFAFINSTEMWNNQHANPHLQGETAMMLKEHFIKTVGVPKWTVGTGGSGGAIQQYLVAQLYPGILDGLQPNVSFPETFMPNVYECRLANNVFKGDPATWTTAKQVAVQGFNAGTCNAWDLFFASPLIQSDFATGCGVTDPANVARVYNPVTNPNGDLFCSFFETNTNLLGKDATGRARRPADNVGVQYGLGALNRGEITPDEFLDFNDKVGGFDRDGLPQVTRTVADLAAVSLAHQGGLRNSMTGPGLANIPIITQRSNSSSVGDIHDTMQDLIIRARLERANGRSDNQVIFSSGVESALAGFDLAAVSIDVINEWLDKMQADTGTDSTEKVVRNKPVQAVDACWDKGGLRIPEIASTNPTDACNVVYPRFSTLRIEAGEAMVQDGVKCQLKPVLAGDYGVILTTAQLTRLNTIFPSGVCDWSKPGVNEKPLRGTYLRLPLQ